jgi:hypothetical protein
MSQEKTLDNTQISNKDIKELEDKKDTKLDNTNTSTTTNKKTTASTKKAPKAAKGAQVPIDSANPHQTTLTNIKSHLAEPKIREEFIVNVADMLAGYSRRGLTVDEQKALREMIDDDLVSKVFKIQKQL